MITSIKARRLLLQAAFLAIVCAVVVSLVVVGQRNIAAQGMATGFAFLDRTTGWPVSFALVDVGPRSTYAAILLAGLLNTLLVGLLTLVFATFLGLALALMRLSGNVPLGFVAQSFTEVFRNVPVILQVFFWYAVLTHLPSPRGAHSIGGIVYLSNRGLIMPAPSWSAADLGVLAVLAAVLVAVVVALRGRLGLTVRLLGAVAVFAAVAAVLLVTGREPDELLVSIPELRGLRFVGGLTLKPEFAALLFGLVLFGAAYIGEVIRGGLLAVDTGRLEAGAALGMKPGQVNRFIRIPLGLRFMLPALANQYVWLMKATTVGIAIGFPDYFAVISTSINQSGQTLELLGLLMLGFLAINYTISFVMNRINAALTLKGRT